LCIGIVSDPATITEAFEAGINFFFISLDLHWPLYEATRQGLAALLSRRKSIRDDIVVGVVSYLDEPLFRAFQVHELIASIPRLQRVDLLIAGAVSTPHGFGPRIQSLAEIRTVRHGGALAIGASFHQRSYALAAVHQGVLDIAFCRYNSAHPNGRLDLFPYIPLQRACLLYNFKSVMSYVSREQATAFGVSPNQWVPDVADYYRFVLTRPQLDGVLCSPQSPREALEIVDSLRRGPLNPGQEDYMIRLSSLVHRAALI
jgi:hypothetical protein